MTKLQIISRLWDHIADLRIHIRGQGKKTMSEIEAEIDVTAAACKKYADCDDDELYALEVLRAAKAMGRQHPRKDKEP